MSSYSTTGEIRPNSTLPTEPAQRLEKHLLKAQNALSELEAELGVLRTDFPALAPSLIDLAWYSRMAFAMISRADEKAADLTAGNASARGVRS
jgi:hypothetical protein